MKKSGEKANDKTKRRTYMSKTARKEMIASEASRIIAKKGLKKTTINDICKACGIAPRTLYLYFKSKKEILEFLVSDIAEKLSEIVTAAIDEDIYQVGDDIKEIDENAAYNFIKQKNYNVFKMVKENRDLLLILLKETSDIEFFDAFDFFTGLNSSMLRIIKTEQRVFQKLGLIRDINPAYSAQVILGSMMLVVYEEILEGDCEDIEHLAEITTPLQFYGFGLPADK